MFKQFAQLVSVLIQNLPELSVYAMQRLIENPSLVRELLEEFLRPKLTDPGLTLPKGMKLIRLHPAWDFMILTSDDYPEVGVAMSNVSGSLGKGWKLQVYIPKARDFEDFVAPCGCCDWTKQLRPFAAPRQEMVMAMGIIREFCYGHGIKTLMMHCQHNIFDGSWDDRDSPKKEDVRVNIIDPYWAKVDFVDYKKFHEVFGSMLRVFDVDNDKVKTSKSLANHFKEVNMATAPK